MSSHRLTVTVPQPCHEDWQVMTPQDRGRFCQSCQKTVMDFTAMSDKEVAEWLVKKEGRGCGRFRADQLGKQLIAPSSTRQQWTWRAAIFALTAWLSTKSTEAAIPTQESRSEQVSQPILNEPVSVSTAAKDSLVIKGTVFYAADQSPQSGAYVFLKGTEIITRTDANGNFKLTLPATAAENKQRVVFSLIGMKEKEVKLASALKSQNLQIFMEEDTEALNATVLVGEVLVKSPWYTPRGISQRIHNLFH